MKSVTLQNSRVAIAFPYDMRLIEIVRMIPDRDWNHKLARGVWSVPVSPFHCAQVIEALKRENFVIDPNVQKCANSKAMRPKLKLTHKLDKKLFPYQIDGVAHIHAANGRDLIADDMGLGKSAEALVWWNEFGGNKVLIVSPANVTWKWALKEAALWAPGRSLQVIESSRQAFADTDITIMSYAIATLRYEELERKPFDTIIFDEAHYLKSNKTKRNKTARKYIKGVPHVLMLTGTPFKNKRIEMYQLLHMLAPTVWSNVKDFGERYCGGVLDRGHWIVPPESETNTEELQKRLAPMMLRRTKKQVAQDLPALTRVSIPMYIDNAKEYEVMMDEAEAQVRAEGYIPGHALVTLNKLRQVVGKGKINAAVELADDILDSGNQLVIHAHHKEVLRGVVDGLLEAGIPAFQIGVIDGSTEPRQRQDEAVAFLDGKKRVMVVSSAGKEGIDLYSANHILFVERQWTPADEEQLEARLHRQGQKNPVTAHYLVARGTVDQAMDDLVDSKRRQFGNVFKTDSIVRDVWLELFQKVERKK